MTFCTAINCMDGRVQLPVIRFLMTLWSADYVDSVTEPGPVRLLAEGTDDSLVASILDRVGISVHQHGSRRIAVVGHHDCAGNPEDKAAQARQLSVCVPLLKTRFPETRVIALWVDRHWQVQEVPTDTA